MLNEGIVGIVSGIIATWIMFFGKAVWESKVTPFLREVRYQGVKIDGAWIGHFKSEAEGVETDSRLVLGQRAHELDGSFTFSFQSAAKNFTLDFRVSGYMWEGYITLNFLPKDRRITSYATALLKLHGGGESLVGQWCFRNVEQEEVTAIPMSLSRSVVSKTDC